MRIIVPRDVNDAHRNISYATLPCNHLIEVNKLSLEIVRLCLVLSFFKNGSNLS